jgi:hypothetical protein
VEVTDPFLGRLLEVVPPPEQRHHTGSAAGFEAVERELGLELPPGFKELTLAYGHGIWFDTVYVLNPFVTWEGNGMPWHARRWGLTGGPEWCDQTRKVRKKHPDWFSRYPIYPEPGGVFPWAFVYGGGVLNWLTEGSAEGWPTLDYALGGTEEECEQLDMSVTEILWRLATDDPAIADTALDRVVRQFRDIGFVAYR